jgi:hypothetical protein
MPIIASRAGGSAGAYGGVGASLGSISGVATVFTFSSTSYMHSSVLSGDDLYGALSLYTGTRREMGMLKMNYKTGVISWVKGFFRSTNQGYMLGVGLIGNDVVATGYSGSDSYQRVARRTKAAGAVTFENGFQYASVATAPNADNSLISDGTNYFIGGNVAEATGRCHHTRFTGSTDAVASSRTWRHGDANYGNHSHNGMAADGYYIHHLTLSIYTDYRAYVTRIIQSSGSIQDMSRFPGDAFSTVIKAIDVEDNTSTQTYLAGYNQASTKGIWVAKWERGAGFAWQFNFTVSNIDNVGVDSIKYDDANGAVYVSGSYNLSSGYTTDKGFIIKLNSTTGAIIWQREFYTPTAPYQEFNTLHIVGENLVASGSAGVPSSGAPRPFVMTYPISGVPSAKVKTIGPLTNWTIATGSFTSSVASKTFTDVTSPVSSSSSPTLAGDTYGDNDPTYSVAFDSY